MNASIGRSFICSAIGAANALVASVAGPIAIAVRIPEAAAAFGDIAVSEGVLKIIFCAAHGDDDDDNDDDDDQAGDADAERAADTASAEAGLGCFDTFIIGVLFRMALLLLLFLRHRRRSRRRLGLDGADFGLLLVLFLVGVRRAFSHCKFEI